MTAETIPVLVMMNYVYIFRTLRDFLYIVVITSPLEYEYSREL
jgi:hypothetical protein